MIDLHLISWNRPKMTDLVIRTIRRNTRPGSYVLHVLDNASERSTVEMLENMRDDGLIDDLICISTNLGLEPARNLLLNNATGGKYFVDIDNDCLCPTMVDGRDWLARMVDLMEQYEDLAALSMRTQVMIGTGNIFEKADKDGEQLIDFPHPGGSFRIMKADMVRKVGGWDRDTKGRGQEERYICGKLREVGYWTAFAVDIRCLHLFGNRSKTSERWGYDEKMKPEDSGHSDIWHPALASGDDSIEVEKYSGKILTESYFE